MEEPGAGPRRGMRRNARSTVEICQPPDGVRPSHAAADRIARLLSLYKEKPRKRHGHRGGSTMTATAISRGCDAVSLREDVKAAILSSG